MNCWVVDPNLVIGVLIRHITFKDVAIRLYASPIVTEDGILINGVFVNLGSSKSFAMDIPTTINISKESLKGNLWELCNETGLAGEPYFRGEFSKSYRSGPWAPILVLD